MKRFLFSIVVIVFLLCGISSFSYADTTYNITRVVIQPLEGEALNVILPSPIPVTFVADPAQTFGPMELLSFDWTKNIPVDSFELRSVYLYANSGGSQGWIKQLTTISNPASTLDADFNHAKDFVPQSTITVSKVNNKLTLKTACDDPPNLWVLRDSVVGSE